MGKIDFKSQIFALFDIFLLHQFSNFNNFFLVCCFLGKNPSKFVPPAGKPDNLYYHNERQRKLQNTLNILLSY